MYQIWYTGKGILLKGLEVGPAATRVIADFPKEIFDKFWTAMGEIREGQFLTLPLSRPMNIVAPGVHELRLKDRYGIYRIFYYLKVEDKILVFHAFQKKTQKTPYEEIATAKIRLKNMLEDV